MKSFILNNSKKDFMELKIGDALLKSCSHGEGVVSPDSWVILLDAEIISGGIPKILISEEAPFEKLPFFIHLIESKQILIDDDGKIFFNFTEEDVNLVVVKKSELATC